MEKHSDHLVSFSRITLAIGIAIAGFALAAFIGAAPASASESAGEAHLGLSTSPTTVEQQEASLATAAKRTSIKTATVKLSYSSTYYTGKTKRPAVTVRLDGAKLKRNRDFTVAYKGNKKVGTATVIVKDKESYKGTAKKTFKIKAHRVGWVKSGGKRYYVTNIKGTRAKGWKKIGGEWYYFDTSTRALKTGGFNVNGKEYHTNSKGAILTGWQQLKHWQNKLWYYFGKDGAMRAGWQYIDGSWYFFNDAKTAYYGVMHTNGPINSGGNVYLLGKSGKMIQTPGWHQSLGGSSWYYVKSTSGELATGWYKVGDRWYVFDDYFGHALGWNTGPNHQFYYPL